MEPPNPDSPKIHSIINNYHNNIKVEQQSDAERDEKLVNIINDLKEEINSVKQELLVLEQTKNADLNKLVSQFRSENVRNIAHFTQKLNRCCNKPMINLEPYVAGVLKNFLNDPEFLSNQKGFTDWLHVLFVAKEDLERRLFALTQNLTKDYDVSIENTAKLVMERVVTRLVDRRFDSGSITEEQIKKVVKSTLMIYDADKTGLVDYAMESMGGHIVTTRCTESYHTGTAVISVLGIPLWYPSNSPRIVIVPGINPGECWAFQNFPGFIVIKLATRILVEAFSLEHVSRLLVPEGRIDSAPKEFEVYGLDNENDKEPVKIGEYVYDYDGDPIQYFAAQQHGLIFTMVEVRIKSNHGNPNYTCLYRFRVHGTISSEPT
ncbi:Sad1 UNC domain containing protein [Asbolus verrucosus]|uniref:Sad1 UNC domain containing protein n=1 Tax=Asbolus verrucosus TaxID=1661398 RepID=A0A482W613_ASBVE|nr:Sad1 UNC domain containing protein [Asbolus verrucosus]